MSSLLKIEWTVLSEEKPLTHRPCGRCGIVRPFVSTGKFRLNANGSRLDAWLIHRCIVCGRRWNKTLFERRPVKSFSSEELEALQANDPSLADRLMRESSKSGSARNPGGEASFRLAVRICGQVKEYGRDSLLFIRNPSGRRVRLDQVLAKGLALPRKEIHRLVTKGVFQVLNASGKSIRRPLPEEIVIALSGSRDCGGSDLIRRALAGAGREEN